MYINDGWNFYPAVAEDFPKGKKGVSERVRLPHTNALLPFNHADPDAYQRVSGYERTIDAPLSWSGQRVFVTFEGAAHRADVFLNGEFVCTHRSGYTAFTAELTELLLAGENTLSVRLDSRETLDQPPFGGAIDYLTYGGLYREAYIELAPDAFIADAFVSTPDTSTLCIELETEGETEGLTLCAELADGNGEEKFSGQYAVEGPRMRVETRVEGVTPWSTEDPALYELRLALKDGGGAAVDTKTIRVGFRTAVFAADGFYLNGQKQRLVGLDRHQSFPYIGYAAPASLQRFDAEVIKNELGLNAVRTSHYPQSRHFIDRCDELGLLVFMEIPGWQHIGGDDWKEVAVLDTREMVRQYRNHPSIVLWGVRINESGDDDEFYARTNAAAHELDRTRQTSGVRFIQKSSLIEDVYAYNDFSHRGDNAGLLKKKTVTPDPGKGYVVSEYNGHMFPAKAFDNEEHRLEHALRHARVLDAMFASKDIAGCFGWCMADYNTHADFGSGDGVCYHGVLDMFRNPKLAAAVYASQNDEGDVLEVSSSMDIGEHPSSNLGTVYAFTNADSVRLYKSDELVREFYPDADEYRGLPHPPVKIDDLIGALIENNEPYSKRTAEKLHACLSAAAKYSLGGMPLKYKLIMASLMAFHGLRMEDGVRLYSKYVGNWGADAAKWRFEAVKNGKTVAQRVKTPSPGDVCLRIKADHTTLHENDTYDMAIVRIEAVDSHGNRLPYCRDAVELIPEGPIELIGPEAVSLAGGAAGAFVRTAGKVGEAGLTVRLSRGVSEHIAFTVK